MKVDQDNLRDTPPLMHRKPGARRRAHRAIDQILKRVQRQQATVVALSLHPAFSTGDMATAARFLTEVVAKTLNVARASVWLLENEQTELRCYDLYLREQRAHQSGQVLMAADFPAYFAALKGGRVIDASDAHTDPRTCEFKASYLEPNGITSMLDATLRLDGQVVGVVCLEQVGVAHRWQADEMAFAGEVADQMAQVLANARRKAELKQAEEQLRRERDLSRTLAEAAVSIGHTLDPEEVLDRLLEQVSRVVPNDAINIMLVEPEDRVRIVRWRGYERFGTEKFVSNVVFDLRQVENLRRMAETGQPLVIADTHTYPGWVHVPEQAWIRAWAGAPIRVREVTVGFLNVDSATADFFTPQHAEILSAFAGYTAIALQNARLYQERARAERLLAALNRAALVMSRAITPQEIFAATVDELSRLGLSCAVFALDEAQSALYPLYVGHDRDQIKTFERQKGTRHSRFVIPLAAIGEVWQKLLDQQALLIRNPTQMFDLVLPPSAQRPELSTSVLSPTIAALLFVEERISGLFVVQGDTLTPEDVPAVTAFAHQVAAAWHKADLMQSLQNSLNELKRTQARLIQAQKMEAVGRLAGGVAHDFNNHLTAINGYTEMLLLEMDPQDPRRQDVYEIQHAAQRSAELTRQLLAFSRKQVIQPQVLNLNSLIENMRKMLERLITENIALHTRLSPHLARVYADPGQIEQVIMNLVVNARDAINEKTSTRSALFAAQVTIETINVELQDAYVSSYVEIPAGAYVLLSVSDNGIGMDQETMAHLFEPFFTTKEVGQGTGLGLSTVYGIIKQSGGHISVYSEPGIGTTFKIYLPRVEQEPHVAETKNPLTATTRGSETILLIEDEQSVRALVRRILDERGYHVLEAANADEALRLCEQYIGPIHLVLTDVVMPGMLNSKELIERIRKTRPGIQVIYMSGYTDDLIVQYGVLDADIRFLQKPFTPNGLALKVREALDERPRQSAS